MIKKPSKKIIFQVLFEFYTIEKNKIESESQIFFSESDFSNKNCIPKNKMFFCGVSLLGRGNITTFSIMEKGKEEVSEGLGIYTYTQNLELVFLEIQSSTFWFKAS